MKTPSFLFAWLAALLVAAPTMAQAPGDRIPDQYIVSVRADVAPAAVAARHGLNPKFVYNAAVNGFAGFVPPGRLNALETDPAITGIVPDRIVAAIGKPGGGGTTTGQVLPEGVKRIGAAPGSLLQTGAGVGVAVVDTGLDFNHADLQPFGSASFSAFGDSAQDDNGHGTHVGGIIAARNNSIGVVGVAPNATLYAVKVLDAAGSGSDASVLGGLDWIFQNAAALSPAIRVVNMSLGRPGTLDDNLAFRAAVINLVGSGVTVVVAAGNNCNVEVSQQVPATYPEVIAVASTTAKAGTKNKFGYLIAGDTASYFTTDGAFDSATGIGVTISAPGEDQENVNNGYLISSVGILSTKLGGGTTRMSGTSMASPHTAGVAALLYQQADQNLASLSPANVRAKLVAGASNPNAPLNSPTACYTFDGDREGVLYAPGALSAP